MAMTHSWRAVGQVLPLVLPLASAWGAPFSFLGTGRRLGRGLRRGRPCSPGWVFERGVKRRNREEARVGDPSAAARAPAAARAAAAAARRAEARPGRRIAALHVRALDSRHEQATREARGGQLVRSERREIRGGRPRQGLEGAGRPSDSRPQLNVVRLPYSNAMLHVASAWPADVAANPGYLAGKTPIEVYDAVVNSVTSKGIFVILDDQHDARDVVLRLRPDGAVVHLGAIPRSNEWKSRRCSRLATRPTCG